MSVQTPPLVAVSDDAEAELARLSALLGVARGELQQLEDAVSAAAALVTGFTERPDGSVSVHFARRGWLTDMLQASLALAAASDVVAAAKQARALTPDVVLIPPEPTPW